MEENRENNSAAKDPHVLVLDPPRKMAIEEKHEEHWNILEIRKGQDIAEEVLTYFRNRTKIPENSNRAQMGSIMSATGIILPPILDKRNSFASDKGSFVIINTLRGTYIISEDGQGQQSGPLTVSYFGPSLEVITGLVNCPLIAAGPVQIVIASCSRNSSEDGERVL